ncbi:MAG: proton-conducting transporter membrane subunit, partial [Actinomycetota bacterium]|nr:proton-conducting transporter membrane subunit [Actinomycetota bacterium]
MGGLFVLAASAAGSLPLGVTESGNWFLRNAWLIPLLPALSFVGILFFGKRLPRGGSELGIAALGIALLLSVCTGLAWMSHRDDYHGHETHLSVVAVDHDGHAADPGVHQVHGEPSVAVTNTVTWFQAGGVEFTAGTLVDGPAVMMLFMVTLVSLLIHVYSTDYVAGDRRYTHFFAFLSLFSASMLLLVVSENTLQLLVAWELVGVCSFVLIGHWWEERDNSDAALKAFLTNRVGDMGLIVGVTILFFAVGAARPDTFGSFSIVETNALASSGMLPHTTLLIAACCLMAAVMSKSGQFFLHTWLPDAMAGPTPVSALIHAATMVVAGVFMIARLYGVFFEGLSIAGTSINLMALIGGFTTLVGACLAFVQRDIKKVLAYSTISQLGYMVMALGVGAWTAAMFHLFTHAFFKACLFLGSGSVSHAVHSFDMKSDMGGL